MMAACASVGRPQGGPRDEMPPEAVRTTPAQGERNVSRRSFSIIFDENVTLDDAFNKVVISPVQQETPAVSANGRRVSIELRDSLVPNTTYTIDFGDAIKDLNEGNVLDGFALEFSTGELMDTLRVSGRVMAASNLEPAQGMLVAAYSNLADSAIRTLRPDRIARTNQYGQFTLRNLADRPYRLYALNDLNRDYHWDRSEDVGFLDTIIHPYVEAVWVTDTLYDSSRADSLVVREGRRYLPNDVLITWFNENYKAQYLKDYARPERRKMTVLMGATPDTLPEIRAVGGPRNGKIASEWAFTQLNERRDSIVLWIADTAMVNTDSLQVSVRYRKPDSLEQLQWTTDTVRMLFRSPKPKKKSKKEMEADTLPPSKALLTISSTTSLNQELNLPLSLHVSQPLASLDTAGVHLETLIDTLWTPVKLPPLRPDSIDPLLGINVPVRWEPGAKYRFTVDSAAVTGIYDEHNRPFTLAFSAKQPEDYSSLTFVMQHADTTAIVELLGTSDTPLRSTRVNASGRAIFKFLDPGTYYARMYFDTNGDGQWTTGILDSIQPEEVAYYSKKIDLKKNWDVEQAWDIYELPLDAQKPRAILKNKPKLKRGEREATDEEEDPDPAFGGLEDPFDRRSGSFGGNANRGFGTGTHSHSGRFQRNNSFDR